MLSLYFLMELVTFHIVYNVHNAYASSVCVRACVDVFKKKVLRIDFAYRRESGMSVLMR
jgi:hypothetical protein